jgi:hypothetical protein|nr:MAG TPA: hypothetical protein [Caudoviricetes sp.]
MVKLISTQKQLRILSKSTNYNHIFVEDAKKQNIMNKIELTELQKALIQKQLNEQYDPFMSSEAEQEAFNDVIDKAEALADELDAVDDYIDNYDGDMIKWFWAKYQEQEK